jgi:hypothetical protein
LYIRSATRTHRDKLKLNIQVIESLILREFCTKSSQGHPRRGDGHSPERNTASRSVGDEIGKFVWRDRGLWIREAGRQLYKRRATVRNLCNSHEPAIQKTN